jgi:hypothetical protein
MAMKCFGLTPIKGVGHKLILDQAGVVLKRLPVTHDTFTEWTARRENLISPPQPRLMHWIDVRDHLPDAEITVLVAHGDEGISMAFRDQHVWSNVDGTNTILGVTHWMDLPESPATLNT